MGTEVEQQRLAHVQASQRSCGWGGHMCVCVCVCVWPQGWGSHKGVVVIQVEQARTLSVQTAGRTEAALAARTCPQTFHLAPDHGPHAPKDHNRAEGLVPVGCPVRGVVHQLAHRVTVALRNDGGKVSHSHTTGFAQQVE